jgi:hypothetical protein
VLTIVLLLTDSLVSAGGLAVSALAIGPRFAGSNPAEDERFLIAIKIRSTTSFGGEVNLSVPFRKILRYVTIPTV